MKTVNCIKKNSEMFFVLFLLVSFSKVVYYVLHFYVLLQINCLLLNARLKPFPSNNSVSHAKLGGFFLQNWSDLDNR